MDTSIKRVFEWQCMNISKGNDGKFYLHRPTASANHQLPSWITVL